MDFIMLLAVNAFFAGAPVFTKIAASLLAAPTLVWIRHTVAFVVVYLVLQIRAPKSVPAQSMTWPDLARVACSAFFSFTLACVIQVEALQRCTASAGALMIALEPIATMGLAVIFLHESFRRAHALALLVAFGGFLLLCGGSANYWEGSLLYLLSVMCEALHPVLIRPLLQRHAPQQLLAWCLFFASLYLLPLQNFSAWHALTQVPAATWGALFYLGVGCSAVAALLWLMTLVHLPVTTVALSWFLQPVLGCALAVVVLGESLTWNMLGGGALILVAVGLLCRHESAVPQVTTRSAETPATVPIPARRVWQPLMKYSRSTERYHGANSR